MRGGDDDTVPVDLVEVDGPDAVVEVADPGGSVGATRVPGTATGRRRRRVLVGVSAAVVLGVAGTGVALDVLDDRRAEARWDALAARGLPLVDLSSPVEEVWRLDFGGYPMTVSDGVLVVQAWDPLGSRNPWRGVDLATGEVLWERADVGSGWCIEWNPTWPEGVSGMGMYASLAGYGPELAPPTILACADASFGGQLPTPGATVTVHAVELATGRDAGGLSVEGDLLGFDVAGKDLVLTTVVADGTVRLTRADLLTGAVRWEVQTEATALDPDGAYMAPWSQVVDGRLYLISPEGVALDVRSVDTGEPLPTEAGPHAAYAGEMPLADGSTVEMTYPASFAVDVSGDVPSQPTVTVRGPDGAERFSVEGELWMPYFSDGSMADRVVVSRPGGGASSLVALDVATGEELWTARAPWSSPVLQVDGLVVTGTGYLSAMDLRTGTEVWEREAAAEVAAGPVTDGTRILVPLTERGAMSLVALDVRTGAEVWTGPTVTGIQLFAPIHGGVLVATESAFLMYR